MESNRDVARTLPVKIERIVSADLWYICIALAVFCLTSKGTFQKSFSGFFPLRGGYPPFPSRVFGHNDFPLRGGGTPPIPLREKSSKNSYFWPKNAYFSPF